MAESGNITIKIETMPPLGLKPRYVHDAQRMADIVAAIRRYAIAMKPIPVEWVEELKELLERR